MTKFEEFLISKGYEMFAFDAKEMKYYKPKSHIISTMVNLGHIYIHNSKDKKQIAFGLSQKGKPTTLISPRPNIRVKRYRTIDEQEKKVIENETYDDSMNLVLSKINFEDIYKAIYNNSICFNFDLT